MADSWKKEKNSQNWQNLKRRKTRKSNIHYFQCIPEAHNWLGIVNKEFSFPRCWKIWIFLISAIFISEYAQIIDLRYIIFQREMSPALIEASLNALWVSSVAGASLCSFSWWIFSSAFLANFWKCLSTHQEMNKCDKSFKNNSVFLFKILYLCDLNFRLYCIQRFHVNCISVTNSLCVKDTMMNIMAEMYYVQKNLCLSKKQTNSK